jgi:hypothetical protein
MYVVALYARHGRQARYCDLLARHTSIIEGSNPCLESDGFRISPYPSHEICPHLLAINLGTMSEIARRVREKVSDVTDVEVKDGGDV